MAAAAPSPMTLLGLIQHLAEVERNWFRHVLTVSEDSSFRSAVTIWQDEVAQARANCASRDPSDTSPFRGSEVSLRWIYIHMIGEYARHCGHADLIRERIDGVTGV
ncbi:Mini-circle uncharacterized 19.1 kDa protein (fragment) [uncultured Mycobacterium sp.]|uniref:Mini-circle uncharacterized 19.1 kDa protein n=1 Tax=uncultured Mycobacterium sp. TaxID=171292 RepID=A0A1Y5NVZ2_9MYCO